MQKKKKKGGETKKKALENERRLQPLWDLEGKSKVKENDGLWRLMGHILESTRGNQKKKMH